HVANPIPVPVASEPVQRAASPNRLRSEIVIPTADAIASPAASVAEPATVVAAQAFGSRWPAWPAILFVLWLAGALFGFARIGQSFARLARHIGAPIHERPAVRGYVAQGSALDRDLTTLAQLAKVEKPRIALLTDLASPFVMRGVAFAGTANSAIVVLPTWVLDHLDAAQLRAMLAHEVAHLARRDPEWKLLTSAWRALFWFLPLAGFAQRRLDDAAELACDAWAAEHSGGGRELAECLVACAERHVARPMSFHLMSSRLVPAMAARPTGLLARIEHLLEGTAMNPFVPKFAKHLAAIAGLAFAAVALPGIALDVIKPATAVAAAGHFGTSINIDDSGHQKIRISQSDDEHQLRVDVDGKITFTDDESDVASLSKGGTAKFSETRAGTTHKLEVTELNGTLVRKYFINGNEQPIDAAGRAWVAAFLPVLARESGLDAEGRVDRLYAKGGANAVLDEVEKIHSGYVRGKYLALLSKHGTLQPGEMDRALVLAGDIDSDYERRQALTHLFNDQALAAPQQVVFLKQASKIESDYERAELLTGFLPKLSGDANVRRAWLDAAVTIDSDYERGRTLKAMLERVDADAEALSRIVVASESMGSDYERRELLVAVAQKSQDADALAPAYAHSVSGIGSDYEKREALMTLIRVPKFGRTAALAVLDAATGIGSDYECREALVALAGVMPKDDEVIKNYRRNASRLSDSERGEVERALDRLVL
ncbi:MAG: M56 family metallopeptidase, partial [Dokdonella sp.]